MIDFNFMPKINKIVSKDHVPLRYFVNLIAVSRQNILNYPPMESFQLMYNFSFF